jgi:hypothetical protein
VTVIGEIVSDAKEQITLLDEQGKAVKCDEKGWD